MSPIQKVAEGLDSFGRDCAVTVALKISDESCKMDDEKRALFMALYDALSPYESQIFDSSVDEARKSPSAGCYAKIKKEREMAMALITQEKMKIFKASVRGALMIAELTH